MTKEHPHIRCNRDMHKLLLEYGLQTFALTALNIIITNAEALKFKKSRDRLVHVATILRGIVWDMKWTLNEQAKRDGLKP